MSLFWNELSEYSFESDYSDVTIWNTVQISWVTKYFSPYVCLCMHAYMYVCTLLGSDYYGKCPKILNTLCHPFLA